MRFNRDCFEIVEHKPNMGNLNKMQLGDLVAAAARLGAKRLLLTESASRRLRMKLALNVPQVLYNDVFI